MAVAQHVVPRLAAPLAPQSFLSIAARCRAPVSAACRAVQLRLVAGRLSGET